MDKPLISSQTGYMRNVYSDPDELAKKMQKATKGVDYDTMVGMGLSGALVIPILARKLGKFWAIVRKSDNSHSGTKIEGQIGHKWIFVDDFVATGKTRRTVKDAIREEMERINRIIPIRMNPVEMPEYVGTYQYQSNYFENEK